MRPLTPALCERLAMVRRQHYGSRGRSRFAQDLGIRPSTYAHYELDRLPPADILLRAARLTRTRVEWIITGEGEPSEPDHHSSAVYGDQLAERLRQLLRRQPELVPQVDAYVDALTRMQTLVTAAEPASPRRLSRPAASELIPIIGSTSAGTARYWHELPTATEGPSADARLEELLAGCIGPTVEASARFGAEPAAGPVSLVQLSQPDERGLLEFLLAPQFKGTHTGCVAWRIDGESMWPRYRDGDLVLTSPQTPATDGHPCVARQRGQLGVNCKLYRCDGDRTWLIPIHPAYPTQAVPSAEIDWAWRVLASVRLQTPRAAGGGDVAP